MKIGDRVEFVKDVDAIEKVKAGDTGVIRNRFEGRPYPWIVLVDRTRDYAACRFSELRVLRGEECKKATELNSPAI